MNKRVSKQMNKRPRRKMSRIPKGEMIKMVIEWMNREPANR
jgi:hypothetical protein